MSARRTSEYPQTFGVKGMTYASLLSGDIQMDTFWSFRSLDLDQFVDWKKILDYKFLKRRVMETESNIGKFRFVDFTKASTVLVKFTFEISITEMPAWLIIVA